MKDPMRPILLATLIMITILLFMNYAVGKEKTCLVIRYDNRVAQG